MKWATIFFLLSFRALDLFFSNGLRREKTNCAHHMIWGRYPSHRYTFKSWDVVVISGRTWGTPRCDSPIQQRMNEPFFSKKEYNGGKGVHAKSWGQSGKRGIKRTQSVSYLWFVRSPCPYLYFYFSWLRFLWLIWTRLGSFFLGEPLSNIVKSFSFLYIASQVKWNREGFLVSGRKSWAIYSHMKGSPKQPNQNHFRFYSRNMRRWH